MIKVIGKISLIAGLIITILFNSSCSNKRKFDIEENNTRFFLKYNEQIEDGVSLDSLTIYYYESYFYYDVQGKDDEKNYHFLYIYRYQQFQIWYSIKYPEKDKDYYPSSYNSFLEAKEKGESKTYSEEEISNFINSYYNK